MAKQSKKKAKAKGTDAWLSLPTNVLEDARYKSQTYRYGLLAGQTIAALALLGGIGISLLGLSGSIEWLVEANGITSKLTNASPGVVIAIIGAVILWRYKPHVSHETTFDHEKRSAPTTLMIGRSSELSSHSIQQRGPGVVRERVTYREEQRGMTGGALENRSIADSIQRGEVRIRKEDE